MKVAIHQPNYLPWLGFFKKIYECDTFVILDDVQINTRAFQNRTRINIRDSKQWLTIPIEKKDHRAEIRDVSIKQGNWKDKHLKTLEFNYGGCQFFDLLDAYREFYFKSYENLIDLNVDIIKRTLKILNIERQIKYSSDLMIESQKNQRILDICKVLNANCYLSGVGARAYNIGDEYRKAGIKLKYIEIKEKPYFQKGVTNFIYGLTMLDCLLNNGVDYTLDYIKRL